MKPRISSLGSLFISGTCFNPDRNGIYSRVLESQPRAFVSVDAGRHQWLGGFWESPRGFHSPCLDQTSGNDYIHHWRCYHTTIWLWIPTPNTSTRTTWVWMRFIANFRDPKTLQKQPLQCHQTSRKGKSSYLPTGRVEHIFTLVW